MLGPLYGAVVLAVADWRVIFVVNLAVGLVLAAAAATPPTGRGDPRRRRPDVAGATVDWLGVGLLLAGRAGRRLAAGASSQPHAAGHATSPGAQPFIPFAGDGRWLTPLGLVAMRRSRCCSWSAA